MCWYVYLWSPYLSFSRAAVFSFVCSPSVPTDRQSARGQCGTDVAWINLLSRMGLNCVKKKKNYYPLVFFKPMITFSDVTPGLLWFWSSQESLECVLSVFVSFWQLLVWKTVFSPSLQWISKIATLFDIFLILLSWGLKWKPIKWFFSAWTPEKSGWQDKPTNFWQSTKTKCWNKLVVQVENNTFSKQRWLW